jgi:hypothetical protein
MKRNINLAWSKMVPDSRLSTRFVEAFYLVTDDLPFDLKVHTRRKFVEDLEND